MADVQAPAGSPAGGRRGLRHRPRLQRGFPPVALRFLELAFLGGSSPPRQHHASGRRRSTPSQQPPELSSVREASPQSSPRSEQQGDSDRARASALPGRGRVSRAGRASADGALRPRRTPSVYLRGNGRSGISASHLYGFYEIWITFIYCPDSLHSQRSFVRHLETFVVFLLVSPARGKGSCF